MLKINQPSNGQIVLNDWTAVRVTIGKRGVYGMTEREGYENPTYLSGLRVKDTSYFSILLSSVTHCFCLSSAYFTLSHILFIRRQS